MPENEDIMPEPKGNEGSESAAETREPAADQAPRGRGRAPRAPKADEAGESTAKRGRNTSRAAKKVDEASEDTARNTGAPEEVFASERAESTGETPMKSEESNESGENRPKRKKRKKKKRPAGADASMEWEDFSGESNPDERKGPRGLNDFSRQRDGGSAGSVRNTGGGRENGRDANRDANRRPDGRNGRNDRNDRNAQQRRGTDNRPIGAQPRKKSKGLWPALGFASRGLARGLAAETHLKVHAAAGAAALFASWWLNVSAAETALVVLAIGGVFAAEYLNTALEALADAVHPRPNGGIGKAKDLAAAGVLMASLTAVGVGLVVFGPHLWTWIQGFLATPA